MAARDYTIIFTQDQSGEFKIGLEIDKSISGTVTVSDDNFLSPEDQRIFRNIFDRKLIEKVREGYFDEYNFYSMTFSEGNSVNVELKSNHLAF